MGAGESGAGVRVESESADGRSAVAGEVNSGLPVASRAETRGE